MGELGGYMSYVPGPIGKVGDLLGYASDGYETALDYHYGDPHAGEKLKNRASKTVVSLSLSLIANGSSKSPGAFGKQSPWGESITNAVIDDIIGEAEDKGNTELDKKPVAPGQ